MNPKPEVYFPGLDAIRGVLILLVVLSHSLAPGILVFVLYSFHMPLFLGISGFLIKRDFIRNASVKQIVHKYLYRMLVPWFLAFGIYYFGRLYVGIPVKGWEEIIYPYYHLWFVPALLLMILILRLLEICKVSFRVVLPVAAMICLGWYMLYREHPDNPVFPCLYYLGDKRLYGYFGFFYFGYLLRSQAFAIPLISGKWLAGLAGVCVLLLLLFVYFPVNRIVSFVPYLVLNSSLIYATVTYFASRSLTKNAFLLFFNQQSLAIYLYHYLVILIASAFFPFTGLLTFALFFTTVFATYIAVYFSSSFPFINKYFFGYIRA